MDTKCLAYAAYWRNSLADAALGNGALKNAEAKEFKQRPQDELDTGRVDASIVEEFFKDEKKECAAVGIMVRPFVYVSRVEHGQERGGNPEIVTPIVTSGELKRDGRLYLSGPSVVPRDILEPLDHGSFAIGELSVLDTFLSTNSGPSFDPEDAKDRPFDEWFKLEWEGYLQHCAALLNEVTGRWPAPGEGYIRANTWYLLKKESTGGAAAGIVALYDDIRKTQPHAPMFERYASETIAPPERCLAPSAGFSQRLGHASDVFPLAEAQRDALAHLLVAGEGDILAVNGPPGTGKTTMLLSVVASLWAKAAIEGDHPPVLLAASTNNQAVTNIIDAFGKDFSPGTGPFAGRWLPDIKSFGAYFPAQSKEKEAAAKYQTAAFYEQIESPDYFARAQLTYLASAAIAFPHLQIVTITDAVEALRAAMLVQVAKLAAIETVWKKLLSARDLVRSVLGKDPSAALATLKRFGAASTTAKEAFKALAERWDEYLADESILWSLFAWLPPVAAKRLLRAKRFINKGWPTCAPSPEWKSIEQIGEHIASLRQQFHRDDQTNQQRIAEAEWHLATLTRAQKDWAGETSSLSGADTTFDTLSAVDAVADIAIRFPMFLLATHYWEGRWLLEMIGILPELDSERKKTGRRSVEKRWHRRMMITPCVVSTFYKLPSSMKASRHNGTGFSDDYLYNFANLLIVDEAGQVLPEVAGASFSLARKAMVIGDTLQIEPIWSIPSHVDVGNLIATGLLPASENRAAYERLADLGKTASAGSAMRIAQHASRYQYDPDLARGLFLYEHRRCYDEIIAYCNDLCYRGKLIPKRGQREKGGNLPAMGYLHINGICVKSNGGSRQNRIEAEAIAEWIQNNKAELERKYDKSIDQIVGVVTPFGGQVSAIARECRKRGIAVGKQKGEMTVGTVHSLQGAERAVVIFSPTYAKQGDGGFIDRSPSMLNVAASRAKDSFLVFGDTDILPRNQQGTPRGLLAKHLFKQESNDLSYAPARQQQING